MHSCTPLTSDNIVEFIGSFDNVLTDCDGVLWNGRQVIEGSRETINKFKKLGKRIFYVTNNSMQTRKQYVAKCMDLGFDATIDQIYCTANAIAGYLQKLNFNKTAYVVGASGITDELTEAGINNFGIGPDVLPSTLLDWLNSGIKFSPDVGAVIVGLDPHFSYPKLLKAASYLKNPECLFIASNMDSRFPIKDSTMVVPGTGTIVAAVKEAAAREPIIIGKPNTGMFEAIAHQHGLDPSRTIMVGDRLDTDILLGANCGLKTLFVLTGVSSLEDVQGIQHSGSELEKKMIPTYYIQKLGDVGDLIDATL